ncbi:HHE domain protein [Aspergillus saccharolyticus JOP 1030-1]|uniref:HHE domain protein n=1 Tax=Aspergillus saccharolyticus JOP 1030-1 TaxID=1450539 RepID=A0A318ZED9_9EURO|nr:HHE domain protein [Aspergillus saccharolyticus JOP 1030-1]PYH43063.1 HHE domain protein [Aspergillus saccharolyticus JOP 1030-1]
MTLISDEIKKDHRDLEEAYNHILNATTDDEKHRWQNQFTWELARHSIGEELVVYPAFEKHLSDGKAMADKDRAEHKTVKDQLEKFQNLKAKDAEFVPTIKGLWASLSEHIKEEEEHDLVKLEAALDQAHSESMVGSFKRTKMFLPTRSHPSAPDKPPFETVAGLLAAPMDHIRDLFRKFPHEASSDIPP